jgi:hypothetical protein
MKQEVVFIEQKEHKTLVIREDRFQYLPQNGWAWLQRLCFWFLRKRKCNPFDEVFHYTRHVINTDKAIQAIQNEYQCLDMAHHEGRHILIGSEDFARLMNSPEIYSMTSFSAEYGYDRQIFGMKVTVVPWMRGILVMPKL